ncbi:MAG: FKBP-type peptidyl-prolyl cis-trans isomerase FkpA [Candidatus Sumerlaeota bacterium]|nr:FKBP-type peptidyl-prolyl cis-trans isomerase FkpA [Candidatus Sumerlaeota bacterium]
MPRLKAMLGAFSRARGLAALILLVLSITSACRKKEEAPKAPSLDKLAETAATPAPTLTPGPTPTPTPPPLPAPYTTASGLKVEYQTAGQGDKLRRGDRVLVRYTLLSESGEIIDEAGQDDGAPYEVVVGLGGMAGWDEALLELQPGATARIEIPAELAHGEQPLVAQIEVLEKLPAEPKANETD